MPFDYYHRLRPRQKAIYRRSDEYGSIELDDPAALRELVPPVAAGLAADDRPAVQRATAALARSLCEMLGVPPVVLRVLARRPTDATAELHGLYERTDGEPAIIRVWMRTAARRDPVAPRTFIRTLLHELCHHFDYELLDLADSFHTEGFFQRESSLARQLLGPGKRRAAIPSAPAPPEPAEPPRGQLRLPGIA